MNWRSNYRRNADIETQILLRGYLASGDQQLLGRYIRELERAHAMNAPEVDPSILKQYIWALEEAGLVDDHYEEIFAGLAKGFFVNAWAYEIDVRGISPGGNYYYDSPPTPPSADKFAKEYITELVKEVGLGLNGFYMFATRFLCPNYDREFNPEHFGYLISASAVGSGVGLWEAVPDEIAEVPDGTYDLDDNLCDICGNIQMPDDNPYVVCGNNACVGGDLDYGGQDDLRTTICGNCRVRCENCDVILCETCWGTHECDVEGDDAQKDEKDWSCESCGHDEFVSPTFCNSGHCAECFDAVDEEHADCGWNGDED